MDKYKNRHKPAFKGQIVKLLKLQKGSTLLDCTLGDGTHTEEALRAKIKVISLDLDKDSIKRARHFIPRNLHRNWKVINANFADIDSLELRSPIDAILMDLGTSQNQLNKTSKGFSFNKPAPLDMRFSKDLAVTAADLLNGLSYKELASLFYTLADEVKSRPIAAAIIRARKFEPIKTTVQLTKIITDIKGEKGKIHPATKVFMGLRMAVNLERENLRQGLTKAFKVLSPKGVLGVISFHSGEDRIVKNFFKAMNQEKKAFLLNQKPISPSKKEIINNNKIRSAKLRLLQKK